MAPRFHNEKLRRNSVVRRTYPASYLVIQRNCLAYNALVHEHQAGDIFKLHANDRVIAVNTTGTYAFAYLDPGRYRLVSQSENANGFVMDLEAGRDYYFLQNTFISGWGPKTSLSRNSKELVMYELDGTYYSNAVRKGGDM